ncbi:MAG TPA: ArsA-related P-loop ATPase [Polyangiaceae bacterium]|nr:ArsA-related P-loop ATPase [Polyangiaceae bacterium]
MFPGRDLNALLSARRVLLCVGCGGVGKTTTCAALGLAAARRGMRALCLTIDPARRLAQSLGVGQFETRAQYIAPEVFRDAGMNVSGSLAVMMLDTKTTFDELVSTLASSREKRDRILDNVLYKYISTQLAGTAEYMAMEKLHAVKDDPAFDVVLLDTPPTSHALDFLDAPERLVGAMDSAAVRWFLRAFEKPGKLSLNLLQKSAATVLRGIGRITGGGFLEQVAVFIAEFNELFGGWRQRADVVRSALRGPEVGYVLVTTPDPLSIREVLFFAERLREQGMVPDAFVVNRMHMPLARMAATETIAQQIADRGLSLPPDAAPRIVEAALQEHRLSEIDRLHLIALEEAFEDDEGERAPLLVHVPDFPYDIHDVRRLAWVADVLAPQELSAVSGQLSAGRRA